jgi:hypothetical protein
MHRAPSFTRANPPENAFAFLYKHLKTTRGIIQTKICQRLLQFSDRQPATTVELAAIQLLSNQIDPIRRDQIQVIDQRR